jgi:copper chaperone CopZ
MKHIKYMFAALLLGLSTAGAAKTIEMNVNGLVCAFCAQGIEKTFKGFPATARVYVSLEHRIVAIQLKDGQDIPDAALAKAITDSGYKLVKVRRSDDSIDAIKARVTRTRALPAAKDPKHRHDMQGMEGMGGHG